MAETGYVFKGALTRDGAPAEWLDAEPGNPDGLGGWETPPEPAIPARDLAPAEFAALSPRNKARVREARNQHGGPLYEPAPAAGESGGGGRRRTGGEE